MRPNIMIDPADTEGLLTLMQKYGESRVPFVGQNENGEDNIITIKRNSISVRTFQHNGWIRLNTYTVSDDNEIIRKETFVKH